MKIALCLFGQPRFVNQTFPYIFENLCKGYDVDVFCHFWFDEDLVNKPYKYGGDGGWEKQRISANAVEEALQLYGPKLYKVEKSKRFIDTSLKTDYCYYPNGEIVPWSKHWKESDEPHYIQRIVNNIFSQLYSINQSNLLRKEYEYSINRKYDWVVKCRTDAEVRHKVKYEEYDPNVVNYSGWLDKADGEILDWMNFGGSKAMDPLMSAFCFMDHILERCEKQYGGAFQTEIIQTKALEIFGVETKAHPFVVTLPRF